MAQSYGDAGPDVAPPATDLRTAEALGRRVAEVTLDYVAGRHARAELAALAEERVAYAHAAALNPVHDNRSLRKASGHENRPVTRTVRSREPSGHENRPVTRTVRSRERGDGPLQEPPVDADVDVLVEERDEPGDRQQGAVGKS